MFDQLQFYDLGKFVLQLILLQSHFSPPHLKCNEFIFLLNNVGYANKSHPVQWKVNVFVA